MVTVPPFAARPRVCAAVFAASVVAAWACGAVPSAAGAGAAPGVAQERDNRPVINHIRPRRDFVGPLPDSFEWTAAPGVDHYAIGIWDEVDRLRWRKDDIQGTSVARPKDLDLESGTYFWTVSGLRGDQEVAKAGLAAFVVEK